MSNIIKPDFYFPGKLNPKKKKINTELQPKKAKLFCCFRDKVKFSNIVIN